MHAEEERLTGSNVDTMIRWESRSLMVGFLICLELQAIREKQSHDQMYVCLKQTHVMKIKADY